MLPSILFTLLLFVSLSVGAAPPPRRDPFHIPVFRRRNVRRGDADLSHYIHASERLRGKYGFTKRDLSGRAQKADIGITNQGADTSYFSLVSVGTPAQQFALVLDTGSSDLWFATAGCAGCSSRTPTFDPTKSSTAKVGTQQPVDLNYGSGSASGSLASDTVTMGPFTVNPQAFVAVDTLSSGLVDGQLAGIMGLGFEGIAKTQAPPFWQALINNNQLTDPEFSFFITRFANDPSASEEEPGGVFTLGGTNSTLFQGNIDFQPVSSSSVSGFWLQTITTITANGKSVDVGSATSAAIDTGTTLIGGPSAAVKAFWGAVSGAVALSGNLTGFYAFPCATQVSVSISFGGPSWPINPADMNLGTVKSGQCLGAIFDIGSSVSPGSITPSWIVGDTFLKNVYSVYRASNPPAVGFAQLSDAAGGSAGAPGPVGSARLSGGGPASTSSPGGTSDAHPAVPLGAFGLIITGALSLLTTAFVLSA
ncbi:aspartic peptidase domain-containing protein [Russula brevipes]|nr:aspartic peptidase domain-containing protein [Russula brevipes]